MQDLSHRLKGTLLKENWGDGPWQNEPDRDEWIDEATGYRCIARRNMYLGAWCGYVGLPKDHPCNGKDCNEVDVDTHWGLTYAGEYMDGPDEEGDDRMWWLGFDCAHSMDISPGMEAHMKVISPLLDERWRVELPGITYKNLEYVKSECASVALQLKNMENK